MILQVLIAILTCLAVYLIDKGGKLKGWGYISGMCSQPLWIYSLGSNEQWGMLAISIWYTYFFGNGIYKAWFKNEST